MRKTVAGLMKRQKMAAREGNAEVANPLFDEVVTELHALLAMGCEGLEVLVELASDADSDVAVWAAMYLLPIREEFAIEQLIRSRETTEWGVTELAVDAILESWEAGELVLP